MRSGRVEQVGAPTELYERPASSFVAAFLGPANEWSGRIVRVGEGVAELELEGLRSCRVPALAGWKPGDAATVVLRPERLQVEPLEAGADGALIGRIDQVAHLGNLVNYRVDLAGRALLAQTPPGRARAL